MIKRKDDAKILVIDLEWAPALVYTFDMWQSNASPEKIVDHGGMLCFCAHWLGSKEFEFYSLWEHGQKGMAEQALRLMSEADALVTYNGDKYDIPKLTGEIILADLPPPPVVASIDLIKTVKKFGLNMNRMAYVAPKLGVGNKQSHEGFSLWRKVLEGDERARRKMTRYCIQDVRITARLYSRILPFIRNHPKLRTGDGCPACESTKTQKRGYRHTRYYRVQRNQCQSCAHWFETTRQKIK